MRVRRVIVCFVAAVSACASWAVPLTPEEIQQYTDDLGVTLTATQQVQIANIVKPDGPLPQWRVDAEARIDQHRKADLIVEVVDTNGIPVEGAQVDVRLRHNAFRFSGVMKVKDLTDAQGNLQGITTNRYQELFLKLFNGAGLNNGFKQKLRNSFESYVPGFIDWAQQNSLPVRGHLLIWPGGTHMTPAVTAKVEELETLWDGVYPSKTYVNVATNDTLASVDAEAGDVVVVVISSNVGYEPVANNVVFSGSASVTASTFDRANGNGPSVGFWYATVLSNGTVVADLTKTNTYWSAAMYHLRPDSGAISVLDTVDYSASSVTGVTNSYSFGGASSGIVVEGVSTYADATQPQTAQWVLGTDLRKTTHSYFTNASTVNRVWIHTGTGNTASYGRAFANARVVGEQAAEASAATLEQELKNIINTELVEWAGLWPVYEWDVINEPRVNHRIQDLIGWDQMAEWFRIGQSNAVLPGCEFLLNEYAVISAAPVSVDATQYLSNRDIMMSHLDIIQTNGGPLDRIGFQSRMTRGHLDPQVLYDRLEDFGTNYGLEMVATEFEVRENAGNGFFPDETERAEITEETLTAYYSHPLVSGFTAWTYMTGDDYAVCSYDGTVKLNGLVWYYLHRIRYTTDESATADASGQVVLRGFKGDYDVTVNYGGTNYPATLTLSSNQTLVISLDDVDLTPGPEAYYATWLSGFPTLGSQTNQTDNPDGDTLDNWYEYALGGNPTNTADAGYEPTHRLIAAGGSNYLEYVHVQRDDADVRGLVYSLETDTDLLNPPGWINGTVQVVGTNLNFAGEGFVTVTNRLPTDVEPQQFLRLIVPY